MPPNQRQNPTNRAASSTLLRSETTALAEQLDCFAHRDWIRRFARDAGFGPPQFTDGSDGSNHPQFWQAIAVMRKPGR